MAKTLLAALVLGGAALAFGSTEASASGFFGYRPNDPVQVICWRGPRWSYSAAYGQSYRAHRRHVRSHRVYVRTCRRCLSW